MIAPLTVGDRHLEDLAAPEPTRERALGLLDGHVRPLAPELEAFVPEEGPGEQAGLAKDLEAVAASQDQPAAGHEARQGPDDRGAARHGPRPQVVAVGEAAWENQAIEAADIGVPVPHVLDRLVEHLGDDVVEIHVTPRAREDHDAESHEASSPDAVTVMPPFDRSGGFYYATWTGTRRPLGAGAMSARSATIVAFQHLAGEILDHRIGEELAAHLVQALPRPRRRPSRRA